MPGYKKHLTNGLLTYIIVIFFAAFYIYSLKFLISGLVSLILGSLFPDIDIKSKGQKVFYIIFLILLMILILADAWQLAAIFSVLTTLPNIVKHRGIFHNIWFNALLVTLFVLILTRAFPTKKSIFIFNGIFFLIGVLSHLISDIGLKNFLRKSFFLR